VVGQIQLVDKKGSVEEEEFGGDEDSVNPLGTSVTGMSQKSEETE